MAYRGEIIDVEGVGGGWGCWPCFITETRLFHFLQENTANKSSEPGSTSNMSSLFTEDLDFELLGNGESF